MAVPATTSKTAAPAATPVAGDSQAKPPEAPKRREVIARRLPPGGFKPIGHFTEPHQVLLPAGWDFSDVLNPDFWCFVAPSMQANASITGGRERLGTVVDILATDHAFYGQIYIRGLRRNTQGQADGAYAVVIGPIQDKDGKACAIDLTTGKPWVGRTPVVAVEADKAA